MLDARTIHAVSETVHSAVFDRAVMRHLDIIYAATCDRPNRDLIRVHNNEGYGHGWRDCLDNLANLGVITTEQAQRYR